MEIKTAFSSQFNHDAAIRGFWCAEHVCYSSLQSINETKREREREWEREREIPAAYQEGEFNVPVVAHVSHSILKKIDKVNIHTKHECNNLFC